jgi:hypothetical protein
MRDTPKREQSEATSDNGEKTVLTLSTLVCVDGPYQDALAHDMAYVAEYPKGIQKHFVNCEETMVMKALARSLLMDFCLQTCLPTVSGVLRACYAAEGVIIWGTAIASPKLAPFGKFTAAESTCHESIDTSLKSYIRKLNQIS